MNTVYFPTINLEKTGKNIERLRKARRLTVRDLQSYFGFEQPQAIYKWQWGDCLPSVDNLFALSKILHVPMQEILVENDQDFVILRLDRCNRTSSDKEICIWASLWKNLHPYDKMCLWYDCDSFIV